MIGPAPILALLVAILHVSIYVLIRGQVGARIPVLILVAWLGAWAGDAIGGRIGLRLLTMGDFHFVPASIAAWVGIVLIAAIASLGPDGRRDAGQPHGLP